MNKRRITLIFILVGFSLAGIIAVQVFWIRNALQVKESQLDATVNEALGSLVRKLEKRNVVLLTGEMGDDSLFPPPENNAQIRGKGFKEEREVVYSDNAGKVTVRHITHSTNGGKGGSSIYLFSDSASISRSLLPPTLNANSNVDSLEKLIVRAVQQSNSTIKEAIGNNSFKMEWVVGANGSKENQRQGRQTNSRVNDSLGGQAQWVDLVRKAYKRKVNVMRQIAIDADASRLPLEKRVDFNSLQGMVNEELLSKGLKVPAKIGLVTGSPSRVAFSSPGYDSLYRGHIYKTALFPDNIIPLSDTLQIYIPQRRQEIYSSAFLPGIASFLFTMIMIITFYLTLRTIVRQKKLADMKADFINNMTHELKTPIATIRLAVDSIENSKTIVNPENIRYFTAAIRDENFRMDRMVEQVLQAARIDRKELRLAFSEIDFGELVERVVHKMQMVASGSGGQIKLVLAKQPIVMKGDKEHLESMVINLIDNAIKYSSNEPKVLVMVNTNPGTAVLTIDDKGIGMTKEEQHRVFDKFYRVPHGNVHNVKGFGLGLSYVKEVVELHGGAVKLKSEPGRGSSFTVYLPLKEA